MPTEKAESNPLVRDFIHKISLNMTTQLVVNDGKSKARIVIYPCRGGRLLNCGVLIETDEQEVADELNAARDSLWLNPGSVEDLLGYLGGYHEAVRQFCGMAEDLKLFSLATRDPPPTFVKGRLALIGDAAHPMLPRKFTLDPFPFSFFLLHQTPASQFRGVGAELIRYSMYIQILAKAVRKPPRTLVP